VLTGSSLLLSSTQTSTTGFLVFVGAHRVTHISGTPSHWRRALMSSSAHLIAPEYVRLSGEIADQAILNHLAQVYPNARIAHAFATTEAGVAFTVNDGITGLPMSVLTRTPGVEMKVENGSLRIRSARTAGVLTSVFAERPVNAEPGHCRAFLAFPHSARTSTTPWRDPSSV